MDGSVKIRATTDMRTRQQLSPVRRWRGREDRVGRGYHTIVSHILLAGLALVCGMQFVSPAVLAGPSDTEPAALLDVRSGKVSRGLLAKGQKLYTEAQTNVDEFEKKLADDQLKSIRPQQINRTYATIRQLGRAADELEAIGETAGVDLRLRSEDLQKRVNQVIDAYRVLPDIAAGLSRSRELLSQRIDRAQAKRTRAEQLTQQGKYADAARTIFSATDELFPMAAWYREERLAKSLRPFDKAHRDAHAGLLQLRTESMVQTVSKLRDRETPDFAGIIDNVRSAADAIRVKGSVQIDQETLGGPALVIHFGEQWKQLQLATLRCRALDWAMGMTPQEVDQGDLAMSHAEFSDEMAAALAVLIDADAERVNNQNAGALYVAYLRSVAQLASLTGDNQLGGGNQFSAILQPELDKLAGKSEVLPNAIETYTNVTQEFLRWLERVAARGAAAKASSCPPLADVFAAAATSRDNQPGLIAAGTNDPQNIRLMSSVSDVMPRLASSLVGTKVSVSDVTGLDSDSGAGVSVLQGRNYARVVHQEYLPGAISNLESDLYVSNATPPLSLPAMIAVESARRGDMVSVGGTITAIYLEPLVQRVATLPGPAWTLIRLGGLTTEPPEMLPIEQVILRSSVEPKWLRHRYFFVDVEQSPSRNSPQFNRRGRNRF